MQMSAQLGAPLGGGGASKKSSGSNVFVLISFDNLRFCARRPELGRAEGSRRARRRGWRRALGPAGRRTTKELRRPGPTGAPTGPVWVAHWQMTMAAPNDKHEPKVIGFSQCHLSVGRVWLLVGARILLKIQQAGEKMMTHTLECMSCDPLERRPAATSASTFAARLSHPEAQIQGQRGPGRPANNNNDNARAHGYHNTSARRNNNVPLVMSGADANLWPRARRPGPTRGRALVSLWSRPNQCALGHARADPVQ